MKKIKKILLILLALLGIIFLAAFIFIQTLKPDYEGEKQLLNLSDEVSVYYDTYGIPHIYAENEEDAIRTLGYVHAQDRLWQMELLRRVASGGLSEVFGSKLLSTDKFFLSLGIDEASARTIEQRKPADRTIQLTEAYLDGINQFIKNGPTPVEFYLTGIEKQPFGLRDVYNSIGYMAFSFAMAQKTDPLLTEIKNKLGPEYLKDLEIDVDINTEWIKKYKARVTDSSELRIIAILSKALENLPIPQLEGSNSWVIAPVKTKSGKVILANDPHIGFAQPSVWYEAHVSTPGYEKYGYHMAGIPFPVLGHDRNLAYGVTMFENDDVDFYYEETHPTDPKKYKTKEGWENYEIVSNLIKIKDSADVTFSYKKTYHGSVMDSISNKISGDKPISISWIYTKLENRVLDALYGISHAKNIAEFQKTLPDIHAPGLNIMYGDKQGNVAWWAAAKLYQMPDSAQTKLIMDGSSGVYEPLRFLDFSENPSAVNPPWNYVYSANNQPDSIAGMQYPGYYLPENRAKRIVQLLEEKDDWDKNSMMEMITDGISSVNPEIITNLAKLVNVKNLSEEDINLLDKLSSWDGDSPLNSVEATIFHRWIYFFLKNTFEDELGPDLFQQFLTTHFHKRLIAPMAQKKISVWWDNTRTEETKESKKDIVLTSFVMALKSLKEEYGERSSQWTWDKVHTLEHGHPIGQVEMFRSFFNVGPFPVHGTREVINNMFFPYTADGQNKVSSGPSTRRIVDFSDIENSMSILPTGQSGNPFSPHYKDQAQMFINGEFRKMMMNKEEIKTTSKSLLIIRPQLNN
ncbi:MAG: penicillin acylase family protein [Eudoraea sp.]|uniref:penicillin acylase family protein n=1 Tax=Eudoraea sp. TaxID=1979955 RepID=UPI003C738FC6